MARSFPTASLLRVDGPAWGLLELSSISRGFVVADAMVKQATVVLERAEAITPGKFIVLVSGGEEEVGEAFGRGLREAGPTVIDELRLTAAHPQLGPALRGALMPWRVPSLAIVETYSVAAALSAADRALKAAEVWLLRLRLARGLGGKAFFLLAGELTDLEAAIAAAREIVYDGMLKGTEIIARPHPDLIERLSES